MNNFNLVAEPPLGFNQKKFKNLILFEELEYSLISVSLSDNHYTLFKKNIFNLKFGKVLASIDTFGGKYETY